MRLDSIEQQAFFAIAHEFGNCGKASTLELKPNTKSIKKFSFNDKDILCVYISINRVMNSDRYSTKEGKKYKSLNNIKLGFT